MKTLFPYQHERGAEITFRARTEVEARKVLVSFVKEKMFGAFALIYDPAALRGELDKITLIRTTDPGKAN